MPTIRIASPNQLANELRRVIAYCETENPSRVKLARILMALSESTVGMEFDTPEAMQKYLHEHPGADPANHSVKKTVGPHGNQLNMPQHHHRKDAPGDWYEDKNRGEHAPPDDWFTAEHGIKGPLGSP